MSLHDFWLRLRAIVGPRRVERELDDELMFHIEMQTRKHLDAGHSAVEARRLARAQFGSTAFVEDECRDARGIRIIETLWQDTRYAVRGFRRNPLFACAVVGIIGIALGVNASLFTIFNAYVLRPEAVRDPDSLYSFTWVSNTRHQFTWREYLDLRSNNQVFSDVLARAKEVPARINAQSAWGQLVSGNYFQLLGVGATIGRPLLPDDAPAAGREPVVVLSFATWKRLFFGDPSIVGRTIRISGLPCEVVGVADEAFTGLDPLPPDFWAPLTLAGQLYRGTLEDPANPVGLEIIGRLKSGVSESAGNAALLPWVQQARAEPGEDVSRPRRVVLGSMATPFPAAAWRFLLLLIAPLAVAFLLILVIACANVANLMLARALARQSEIGIRLSIGASRGRIVQQLLTESLLLALTAGFVAVTLSQALINLSLHTLFATMPPQFAERLRVLPLHSDWRIVGFLMSAATTTAVVFGLLPALQSTRSGLVQMATGHFSNRLRSSRARNILVVAQITASTLLLICTAILLRGSNRASAVNPGIRTASVLEIGLSDKSDTLRAAALAAVQSHPLVASLAVTWPGPPLSTPGGRVPASSDRTGLATRTPFRYASAQYFTTLGIPLLGGRTFEPDDSDDGLPVAIVSQDLARRLWPNESAMGQTLTINRESKNGWQNGWLPAPIPKVTVVGVVGDVSGYGGIEQNNTGIYLPIRSNRRGLVILTEIRGDIEAARRQLDEAITRVAPDGVEQITPMSTYTALYTFPVHVAFWISLALAVLAGILTLSGIYSVLSYLVAQRTKEIGIRMTLGASTSGVTWLVLKQSFRLVVFGLVGGGLLAPIAARLLVSSWLGQAVAMVDPFDRVAYTGAMMLVLAASVAAAAVPAFRAARIDPIATLRHD